MGKDPTTCTVDDAKAACAKIKKARESGQIRKFTGNDYADDLAAGNIAVAIAWSGDIQGLRGRQPGPGAGSRPRKGRCSFSDNMMIPKTSTGRRLAMAWINYVLRSGALGADRRPAPPTSPT